MRATTIATNHYYIIEIVFFLSINWTQRDRDGKNTGGLNEYDAEREIKRLAPDNSENLRMTSYSRQTHHVWAFG